MTNDRRGDAAGLARELAAQLAALATPEPNSPAGSRPRPRAGAGGSAEPRRTPGHPRERLPVRPAVPPGRRPLPEHEGACPSSPPDRHARPGGLQLGGPRGAPDVSPRDRGRLRRPRRGAAGEAPRAGGGRRGETSRPEEELEAGDRSLKEEAEERSEPGWRRCARRSWRPWTSGTTSCAPPSPTRRRRWPAPSSARPARARASVSSCSAARRGSTFSRAVRTRRGPPGRSLVAPLRGRGAAREAAARPVERDGGASWGPARVDDSQDRAEVRIRSRGSGGTGRRRSRRRRARRPTRSRPVSTPTSSGPSGGPRTRSAPARRETSPSFSERGIRSPTWAADEASSSRRSRPGASPGGAATRTR